MKLYKICNKISLLLHVLASAAGYFVMEAICRHSFIEAWNYMTQRPLVFAYNAAFIFTSSLIVYLFHRRVFWRILVTLFWLILAIINGVLLLNRVTPFTGPDLHLITDAMKIANKYLPVAGVVAVCILFGILVILLLILLIKGPKYQKKIKYRYNIPLILLAVALFAGSTQLALEKRVLSNYFGNIAFAYEDYGYPYCLGVTIFNTGISCPRDYSEEEIERIEKTEDNLPATNEKNQPNILFLQLESFFDPTLVNYLKISEDPIPTFRKLMKEYSSGYYKVPAVGAGTANTEFEFLTGDTMAFLPAGSIPYQQYITKNTPSMASYLKSLGYETYAMHPYYASGWNRDKIYPLLGFDSFYSSTDFYGSTYERGYIDDSSCVDKIIETYEKKDAGTPAFIFNVTMQNHSPYTDGYQNLQGNVTVDGTVSAQLSEYLTLVKLSDTALEKLIDYFETQDEPTVIVFFGDHQPTDAVVEPIWNLEGKSSSDLTEEENQLRYKVPYVIWANYDIDEAVNQESSANYLGAQMMEAAGIPLSDYQNYLLEQKKEMPLISTQHTEAEGSDAWLNYQTLQYYLLFDWDGEK